MKKHKMSHHSMKRDYDHMAPNAGYSDRSIKHTAESHGADIHLSEKQHVTENAMLHDWGAMPYSQEQYSNGSMNYMSHKEKIAAADAHKIKRPQHGVDNAS